MYDGFRRLLLRARIAGSPTATCLIAACMLGFGACTRSTSPALTSSQGRQNNDRGKPRSRTIDTADRDRLSQWGITWYFDRSYPTGHFVNGDWWVKGPVTIVRVDPAPTDSPARNGSMVNPVPGTQGYDDRIGFYDKTARVRFPLKLGPNSSLVSTISLDAEDYNGGVKDLRGKTISSAHVKLRTAAVLTVLAKELAEESLRPPYCGNEKPLYETRVLNWQLLPDLEPVAATPKPDYHLRAFERVWLTHIRDWQCRLLHPSENMPNYYRDISQLYSEAAILVSTRIRPEARVLLVARLLQNGVDQYGVVTHGYGDSAVNKFPILFAGVMLDAPEIYYTFLAHASRTPFREDWQTYYPKDAQSQIQSTKVPKGQGWTGAKVLWRQDPGDMEHEHLHPSEWYLVPSGGGGKRETYRHGTTSKTWVGMALIAKLMNLELLWDHPAFFDYVDRWMDAADFTSYEKTIQLYYPAFRSQHGSAGSEFVQKTWERYSVILQ